MKKCNWFLVAVILSFTLGRCNCGKDSNVVAPKNPVLPGLSYVTFDCDTLKKYQLSGAILFELQGGTGTKKYPHAKFGNLFYLIPDYLVGGSLHSGINNVPIWYMVDNGKGGTVRNRVDTLKVTAEYFENNFNNPATLEMRYTKVFYNNKEVSKYIYTGDGSEAYIYILPSSRVDSGNCAINL